AGRTGGVVRGPDLPRRQGMRTAADSGRFREESPTAMTLRSSCTTGRTRRGTAAARPARRTSGSRPLPAAATVGVIAWLATELPARSALRAAPAAVLAQRS
ncbi:hypothetical protein NE236_32755, partial [Actinoallomurus purpureus]|uniref:hypothetical protein n=1 Tax=Actinoallomurus purpureus TaxID=478114 RepID=UPI002092E814